MVRNLPAYLYRVFGLGVLRCQSLLTGLTCDRPLQGQGCNGFIQYLHYIEISVLTMTKRPRRKSGVGNQYRPKHHNYAFFFFLFFWQRCGQNYT